MRRIYLLVALFISCNEHDSDYVALYSVASPDSSKCLSFVGEYNKEGTIKNKRFYLLGYNPQTINKIPDTNYLCLNFYGEMDGISVKWDSLNILVNKEDVIENKLSDKSKLLYFSELSIEQEKQTRLYPRVWHIYSFKDIHQEKYKSCNSK